MKETKLTRDFPSNSDKSKKVKKKTPEKPKSPRDSKGCQPIAHGAKKNKEIVLIEILG